MCAGCLVEDWMNGSDEDGDELRCFQCEMVYLSSGRFLMQQDESLLAIGVMEGLNKRAESRQGQMVTVLPQNCLWQKAPQTSPR